ncbi:serine/threonine-protein kinase [Kitasatospora azatica]|uniref:serine/threonine-protein kinase n=1 Tax=Kitasatospora azatica TaxID=58347 RepID=UPI00068C2A1C|nr:serine/threonine-protein kinase [Kitasatospora azatica]
MSPFPIFQPLLSDDPAEVAGYRLYARLGSGGMGRVYLSYTPGGRPVAIKVVRPELAEDPEFRRRFAQEVASAQRIHGLYTAQLIDSGTTAEVPWLVTAYVPGPSLQQVIREHGPLPVRTVLLLMGGIAEALQAIHSVGVVHRDLKPANVLMAADGPRVIDFGIARAADATSLTSTGLRVGSPSFMAPEQAQGREITPAADVFALGALAAYVAGGVPPFGEGSETAVLFRVVYEEPEMAAVPADLRGLLLRCLAKSPEERPAPAEIIESARSHPEVGGQLRFTDGWLPATVDSEITRRSELPSAPATTVAPPGEVLAGPLSPARQTMVLRAAAPSVHPVAPATETLPTKPQRPKGASRKTVLAVAVATALGGAAAGVALTRDDHGGGGRSADHVSTAQPANPTSAPPTPTLTPTTDAARTGSPAASGSPSGGPSASGNASPTARPPKYTAVYKDRVLSIGTDADYQFDLKNGKVEPGGAADWHLSTYGPYYQMSDGTDAYIAKDGSALTAEQCSAGIDREPTGELAASALPANRFFCLRSRASGAVVVLRVVKPADTNGATTCSLSYYRNDG